MLGFLSGSKAAKYKARYSDILLKRELSWKKNVFESHKHIENKVLNMIKNF